MKKILCIGSVTTDVIVTPANDVPPPGILRSVDNIQAFTGGCAVNAAVDIAKLGGDVHLSCKIGNDSFGDFILKTAKWEGIGTKGIIRDTNVSTTVSVVCVNTSGERSFLYNPGSAARFKAEDVPMELVEECDIIFVAGAMLLTDFDGEPCARIMKRAQELGKFTVMDTAWDFEDIWLPKIEAVIPYLDLFMPSIDEAIKLSGKEKPEEIAKFFMDMGAKNVIIKLGKDGAYFKEANGKEYTLPTYKNIKPVDTTGAGDSFCAGFLFGLSKGWSFEESGKLANAVGTHCIMEIGASTGIKSFEEILNFMRKNKV